MFTNRAKELKMKRNWRKQLRNAKREGNSPSAAQKVVLDSENWCENEKRRSERWKRNKKISWSVSSARSRDRALWRQRRWIRGKFRRSQEKIKGRRVKETDSGWKCKRIENRDRENKEKGREKEEWGLPWSNCLYSMLSGTLPSSRSEWRKADPGIEPGPVDPPDLLAGTQPLSHTPIRISKGLAS